MFAAATARSASVIMDEFSQSGGATRLPIGLHLSCQLGESFQNNAITLMAVCLVSDIVEGPTMTASASAFSITCASSQDAAKLKQ
ncbi:hypothetical protein NKH84_29615 [Mesorhizobium sp. M0902]|uniref:hypothetical protein n=1 Tax=Mesorhizobium sp. M0902 TaxID=2957021 RepID=UPI003336A4A0